MAAWRVVKMVGKMVVLRAVKMAALMVEMRVE